MKITFVVTDESGNEYRGSAELLPISKVAKASPSAAKLRQKSTLGLSFDQNPRAFMKKFGRGLSGPQKFTLLVARLTKGKNSQQVSLGEIEKHWNSMKALMDGPFNRAHSNRAKDNGWVDSPRRGVYTLSSSWREALRTRSE